MTDQSFSSFAQGSTAVVIGASGGIGAALADALERSPVFDRTFRFSRNGPLFLDLTDEASIAAAAGSLDKVDLVLVATGVLHDENDIEPEKTWRALDPVAMARVYQINAIGPGMVAKHFLPLLSKDRKSVFAALSARVGSIGDNRLGGWHAYRASKAALNMLIRNFAIELTRSNKQAIAVGLHPGTVATELSAPFQSSVPAEKLFAPEHSAERLLSVVDGLTPSDSGGVFAWDGLRIPE